MFTKTTASANPSFTEDTIILNNEEGSKDNIRFINCLTEGLQAQITSHANFSRTAQLLFKSGN